MIQNTKLAKILLLLNVWTSRKQECMTFHRGDSLHNKHEFDHDHKYHDLHD